MRWNESIHVRARDSGGCLWSWRRRCGARWLWRGLIAAWVTLVSISVVSAEVVSSHAQARVEVSAMVWIAVAQGVLPDDRTVSPDTVLESTRDALMTLENDVAVALPASMAHLRLQLAIASLEIALLSDIEVYVPADESVLLGSADERDAAGSSRVLTRREPAEQAPSVERTLELANEVTPVAYIERRTVRQVRTPTEPVRRRAVIVPAEVDTDAVEVWTVPVANPRVTSPFGPRIDPITGQAGRMHRGTDYGGATGTPIYATGSGRVLMAGWCDRGTGNCVVIEHEGGWRSQYFHMDTVTIRAGTRVAQGEQIGTIGSTGRSTGPHLHFQVGRDGTAVDPELIFGTPIR